MSYFKRKFGTDPFFEQDEEQNVTKHAIQYFWEKRYITVFSVLDKHLKVICMH